MKKLKETALAIGASAEQVHPFTFKVKRVVTLPLWKWVDGEQRFFRVEEPIRIGKTMKIAKGEKEMEPAHLCIVTNLQNGQRCELIMGAVLRSTLEETYPNNGYVGLSFACIQSKIEGKRYKGYSLSEIETE